MSKSRDYKLNGFVAHYKVTTHVTNTRCTQAVFDYFFSGNIP